MSNHLDRLKQMRKEDVAEQFQEEKFEYEKSRNKRKVETLSDSDDDEPPKKVEKETLGMRLMKKHGYQEGSGLGKAGQGKVEPVELSKQRGRAGLGHEATNAVGRDFNEKWDESTEEKVIEEFVSWLTSCDEQKREFIASECTSDDWMSIGPAKMSLDDEDQFCDQNELTEMLKAKSVFDVLNDRELREARTRANPYETIGSAFFQNRAAMKTANIDKVFDWIISGEIDEKSRLAKNPLSVDGSSDRSNDFDRKKEIFYFADVCAGPGGFSEYMLWRKGFYNTKGFGFTLKGKDDFKLGKFTASSAYFFEPYYGKKDDGDVTNPDNIDALQSYVGKGTNNVGVDLMMADGGFSVEGQENIQEILSKRLYLCQLLVSLCIVKEGGNFFCKLFDIFTPFSAGLIYLMHVCYDEISLHKPHTSRPANSERYIICKGLRKEFSDRIRDYLKRINRKLDEFSQGGASKELSKKSEDVISCVPFDVMRDDDDFYNYLKEHNEKLCRRQTMYLKKYLSFAKNQGQIDKDQGRLRENCLQFWMIPNRTKGRDRNQAREALNPHELLVKYCTVNKLYGDEDHRAPFSEFSTNFIKDNVPKACTHSEYVCNLLSETRRPSLLVSCSEKLTIFTSKGFYEYPDRDAYRIPENTILYIDEVQAYEGDERVRRINGEKVVRIVDGAVLHGDNISRLPYEERMLAIAKFCKALEPVSRNKTIGYGKNRRSFVVKKLVCAEFFSPENLEDYCREKVRLVKIDNEEKALVVENGISFICSGVRFSRLIKRDWKMFWSSSTRKEYAARGKESVFKTEFASHHVWASFWESSMITKNERDSLPNMQSVWRWNNSLEDNYGFRVILQDEEHKSGKPTVHSISEMVRQVENTIKNI